MQAQIVSTPMTSSMAAYPLLGEGNANSIYIRHDGLLRVSKNGLNPQDIVDYSNWWNTRLPGYVVPMQVVHDEIYGPAILMAHIGKGDTLLVEFKPKWLVRSTDAPLDAKACRTCAVDCVRGKSRKWCPIQLSKREDLLELFTAMQAKHPEAVAEYFASDPLLSLLAEYQKGPSVYSIIDKNFLDTMSCRDCTILVEGVEAQPNGVRPEGDNWSLHKGIWVRAQLVDLDPKSESQVPKWRDIELSLIKPYRGGVEGCWYARE